MPRGKSEEGKYDKINKKTQHGLISVGDIIQFRLTKSIYEGKVNKIDMHRKNQPIYVTDSKDIEKRHCRVKAICNCEERL